MNGWAQLVLLMLLGSSFGRSFYYLGIPPARIFIGEIVILLFFILRPREFCDRWLTFLMRESVFGPFAWTLLLSILYGICELVYGLESGYSLVTALENLVFNIYPVYFFLGLWTGADHPTLLRKVIHGLAWVLALYGPAYFLFLHTVRVTMPGSDTPVFSQPGGGGLILLSLLALERKPSRFWLPMTMAAILMLAVQVRAEWLGTMVGLVIWGTLERKMTRVVSAAALVLVILAIGFVADVNLPSPQERGGSISSREIVARGIAAVAPSLAREYTDSRNVGFYYGTVSWRTRWWSAIWDSANESNLTRIIGHGYGFPLANLVPYLNNTDLRTPHNIFFFALGYSGWTGVLLFASLQVSILGLLWRVYRISGQSWGLAFWAYSLTSALFGNSLESPIGAIPYYLLLGVFIGPVLARHAARVPALAGLTVSDGATGELADFPPVWAHSSSS